MAAPFSWPGEQDRCLIVGQTGSGKTQAALWQLSHRDFDDKPWIILDFKGDDMISEIPCTAMITLSSDIPDDPGIYIARVPVTDPKQTEAFLYRLFDHGDCGLYIDELSRLGQHNHALRALYTMGRSKRIPVISLTQRPMNVEKEALAETSYFQIFDIIAEDDRKELQKYIRQDRLDLSQDLPRYSSFWYDCRNKQAYTLGPAPDIGATTLDIETRLPDFNEPFDEKITIDDATLTARRGRQII